MKLSLDFIAEKLRETYGAVECRNANGGASPSFSNVRIYNREHYENAPVKPLVIATPSICPAESLAGCEGLVWVHESEPPQAVPCIWLPDVTNVLDPFDAILDIMERFSSWSESVRNALLEQMPTVDVMKMLAQVTGNPFWYADTALRVQYMSESKHLEQVSSLWRYQVEHGRYSAETLSMLIASGDLDRINQAQHAWLFTDSKTFNGAFVSKTIVCNGNIYGYAFIIESERDSSVCDIELLEMMGNLIASYIQHSRVSTPASNRFADQMLKECLLGSATSESDLADLANLLEWGMQDSFVISVFERDEKRHAGKDILKAQMHMLEDNLPGRVILFESCIMLISDVSKLPGSNLDGAVESLCRKLNWKAGMSNQFEGLEQLNIYYQQAKIALRIGSAEHPDRMTYPFSDYSIFYICEQLSKQVSESLLIHQDVRRIAESDEEAGGTLLETLEVYLNNERSVAKTASELFLHRNSVAYRIEKIRSIMKTDLDDDENRLNIILSLRIWNHLKRQL